MPALLLPNEILSMSAQAARRLVESGDGDGALLYLALLESGGDEGRAAGRLRWEEDRLAPAWERLAALELAEPRGARPPAPAPERDDRPPEYSREEIAAALDRERGFRGLTRELEGVLGRVFTDSDLRSLYTMYDYLALPPEVILSLTGWVVRRERRQRDNPAYLPRMSQVRTEAFRWKRLGLDTLERAEEYLRAQERVDEKEWAVLQAVGVAERRPAVGRERQYIAAWVEMDLPDELLRLAYERTVYQKGAMSWPYMNKILECWHRAGYRTAQQVEAEDKPPRQPAARPAKGAQPDYQPSLQRIQESDDWLDEFFKKREEEGGG